jgi:predicted helicase
MLYVGHGALKKTLGPEDVFNYAYAVFPAPSYRERCAEFLKLDFPRLPLTSDPTLFRRLCKCGSKGPRNNNFTFSAG